MFESSAEAFQWQCILPKPKECRIVGACVRAEGKESAASTTSSEPRRLVYVD